MRKLLLLTLLTSSIAYADDPAPPAAKTVAPAPPAAKAVEPAAPAAKSVVVHVAPTSTVAGKPIELEAMIDAPFAEQLSVRWRTIGASEWHDVPFERSSAGGWFASLPAAASPGVEYYIRGADQTGGETDHFASAASPHVVRVDPTLSDRLESLDRERLANRLDEVSFDVVAHNYGNRYDIPDWFVRSEATYTHNLLRVLHQVGFGFGTIGGRTPTGRMTTADDVWHSLNYGYGQLRMRLHPSVFLDGRVGLGVSNENFVGLGRGVITFGKPWRSNVSVGGEYFGDLGPTAFVRLQWDTAWPVLMGASVVRCDLPGVIVDPAGLYIAYDVAYQMERVTVKAQLSYGARDGSPHAGGGIGTAIAF
ncbi:MAG TPA: hypothetical protein VFV99_30985 [Kofleriaceae bacterium]|nr:hypothetical protein [Kofleriaceae bacterium]